MKPVRLGIVDTMFARVDMGAVADESVGANFDNVTVVRRTVPGMKDLPVACKILLDGGCDICLALAMPGGAELDRLCAHEASQGIMMAQLFTNKHIVEVFVHADEAEAEEALSAICVSRILEHSRNAIWLVAAPDRLSKRAGQGIRQGYQNAGSFSGET